VLGPVFITERSVVVLGHVTVVVTVVLVLLEATGSDVPELTVAVFVAVDCVQFAIVGTLKVSTDVAVAPDASVPTEH
jgi:hypothetical protein